MGVGVDPDSLPTWLARLTAQACSRSSMSRLGWRTTPFEKVLDDPFVACQVSPSSTGVSSREPLIAQMPPERMIPAAATALSVRFGGRVAGTEVGPAGLTAGRSSGIMITAATIAAASRIDPANRVTI